MTWNHSIRISIVLGLVLLLQAAGVSGEAGVAKMSGKPGRVIILDASGSMRREDFNSDAPSRLAQAKRVFNAYMDLLLHDGDTVPTAVYVFGSVESWDAVSAKYGDPSKYPMDGELCHDVLALTEFEQIDESTAHNARKVVEEIRWNGMSPVHASLELAIEAFDPKFGGEIILISDMEDINCLPREKSVCDALNPQLAQINSDGGVAKVTIYETPSASLREDLSECVNVVSKKLDLQSPDPEGIVREVAALHVVKPNYYIDGDNNLDPDGIDLRRMKLKVVDTDGGEVVSDPGPVTDLRLRSGNYELELTDGITTWKETTAVSSSKSVDIELPPSQINVFAEDGEGQALENLSRLDVMSRNGLGGPEILEDLSLPFSINLANRTYRLQGTLPSGEKADAIASLRLDESLDVVLKFESALRKRQVKISVRIGQPTLLPASDYFPGIMLRHPDGRTTPLSSGENSVHLAAGMYELEIGGVDPGKIEFQLPSEGASAELDIEIVPGWLRAESADPDSKFVLMDSGLTPLFSFSGPVVEHSLPDGNYKIMHLAAGMATIKEFTISTGKSTKIDFR